MKAPAPKRKITNIRLFVYFSWGKDVVVDTSLCGELPYMLSVVIIRTVASPRRCRAQQAATAAPSTPAAFGVVRDASTQIFNFTQYNNILYFQYGVVCNITTGSNARHPGEHRWWEGATTRWESAGCERHCCFESTSILKGSRPLG